MNDKMLNLKLIDNNGEKPVLELTSSSLNDCVEILAIYTKVVENIFLANGLEFEQNGVKGVSNILQVNIINQLKEIEINVPNLDIFIDFLYDSESKEFETLEFSITSDLDNSNDLFSHILSVLILQLSSSIADKLRSLNIPISDSEIISAITDDYLDILNDNNQIIYDLVGVQLLDLYKNFS